MTPPRPCLTCGTPTRNGSYCTPCNRTREQRRNQIRTHYQDGWATTSRQLRAQHPWCELCGATTDLTVDHITPRTLNGGLRVLCRPCNSRLGGGMARKSP